jgi:uncharacterized membrane protein
VPIGSFFAAGYLFSREKGGGADRIVPEENDIKPWFGQSVLGRVCFWIVVLLSFIYLNFEVIHSAGNFYDPLVLPALTLAWIGLAALLLREMLANRASIATVFFWVVAAAIVLKVFLFDFFWWRPDFDLAYRKNELVSGFLMRMIDYGAVVAFFLVVWQILTKSPNRGAMAKVFGYGALAGAFMYTSLEVWSGLTRFSPDFRMGGISIFWGLFALGLLLTGISKSQRVLRWLGLILMGVTIGKIFLVDLSDLEQLQRIIAFIILGVVVLISSFLYLKYRHRFVTFEDDDEEEPAES